MANRLSNASPSPTGARRKTSVRKGKQAAAAGTGKPRRADDKLEEPSALLTQALLSMDAGMSIIGRDYIVKSQNPYLKKEFGNVVGGRCSRIYMGYEDRCPGCPLEAALESKVRQNAVITGKNGRYYDVIALPLPQEAGGADNIVEIIRDITDRREADMQLRESEERLRILFDKAPDPYLIMDMTGHFIEANKAAEDLFGYRREELAGKSYYNLGIIASEDEHRAAEVLTKNAGGEPSGPDQFRVIRKDGDLVIVEIVSHPVVFKGSAAVLVMARDVTQRERLERQRELYLKVLERLHSAQADKPQDVIRAVRELIAEYSGIEKVGIWISAGGDCEHCTCDKLHCNVPDASGAGAPACICNDVLAGRLDTRRPFFTVGGSFWTNNVPGLMALPDGREWQNVSLGSCYEKGYQSVALIPLKTDMGNIGLLQLEDSRHDVFNLRRVEYFENIASIIGAVFARRQTLDQLRESERFNSSLMENAPNPITVINPDTSLRYANPAFEKLLGYSMEEVVGIKIPYPWWPKEKLAQRTREVGASVGGLPKIIDEVVNKDGKRFTVELRTMPVKTNGKIDYYLAHWTDITDIMEAEEALRQEKDRARNYLDMAGTMLMVLDKAGDITLVNKKLCDIMGYTEDEIIGKNWFDTLAPKDTAGDFKAHFLNVMVDKADARDYEYHESRVVTKGGDERIIAWYCRTLYDDDGAPNGNINSGEDITERLRAEEALRDSRANYNAVVDNANIGITVIQDGRRVYYNSKMYEMLGYTKDEYKKTTYLSIVHPDDRALAQERITQKVEGKKVTPESMELKCISKSGGIRWIETRSVAIQWNSKPAVQAFMIDVTERKKAEEALKESEEFSKSILQNAPNPVVVTDVDTSVVYANPAFQKLTGFTMDEIAGLKSPYPWWLPELLEERQAFMRQNPLESREKVEGANIKKNGERFWVSVSRAMINVDGVPKYRLTNWVDITARRLEEEKHQTIIQAAIDGFHLSDKNGKILEVNDAACKMLGYTREELLKMHTKDIDATRNHQDVLEHLHRLKAEGKDSFDTRHRCKDGRLIDVTVSSHLLGSEEGHIAIFVHDITARKKYEQRTRELKVLKEVDFLRRKLLSNVSHELRTPLASIKGFVSTLLRTDAEWSQEDSLDFLQTINLETDKLVHIINDLLDMSRIDAGELRLTRTNHMVDEIYESVGHTVAAITTRHKLIVEPPKGLPMVSIDLMRIDQVLTNLIENAVKYSPPGSEIVVKAMQKGAKVVISVADYGEGISEEAVGKVFDRFYQIESIATGHRSGTGLGLSICRGIIEAHGGKIWVTSKLGEGSTFSFSLPVGK